MTASLKRYTDWVQKKKGRKVQEIAKGECRCIIDMVKKSIIVKKIKKTAW